VRRIEAKAVGQPLSSKVLLLEVSSNRCTITF
jgi:hypothetical protein